MRERIDRLFRPAERAAAAQWLEDELGNNLFFGGPFFSHRQLLAPEADSIEQVRFAALKLSDGDVQRLADVIEAAHGNVVELVAQAGLGAPGWADWLPAQRSWP